MAQSVDGDETTFAWDWVAGLLELLAATESTNPDPTLYLVGHETLGSWDGATWAYHLPDALDSVRQVAGTTRAVLDAREWTPYGVEVGAAQAGLGYTGEWWDADAGLVYLRARWYEPYLNQFVSPDPIVPDFRNPQSINRYVYALGNPVRYIDPAGLCAITGSTDCEKFVSEIRCIIEGVPDARACNSLVALFVSEEALVLDLLAWYYSGIPFTWNGLYMGWLPQQSAFGPGDPDRWSVPRWDQQDNPSFSWDHPINQPGSELGQAMRQNYGFRRPYFEQAHHYCAFLKFAYHMGGPPVEWMHKRREIEDQLQPALDHIPELEQRGEPRSSVEEWYAWMYRESVYDLYIVNQAVQMPFAISIFGVDVIPDYIESKWCATSEADVWSLESEVDQFYFEFPEKYWPHEKYWPGR